MNRRLWRIHRHGHTRPPRTAQRLLASPSVECGINQVKQQRAVAPYEAAIHVPRITIWLNALAGPLSPAHSGMRRFSRPSNRAMGGARILGVGACPRTRRCS